MTDQLNIRSGPGTNYDIVGQANTTDIFPIVSKQNDWIQIQLDDQTGWVLEEYITIEQQTEAQSDKREQSMKQKKTDKPLSSITIQYDHTQLRKGASTNEEIIHYAEKGAVYKVVSEDGDWYEITNKEFSGYVSKQLVEQDLTYTSPGLKHKTIVIDAGHGGRDVGAIGATGVYEKDVVDLTAKQLEQALNVLGANVVITRPEDKFISLGSRIAFSNVMETDAFISLHYNSVPELPSVSGIETYYYSEQNKQLADAIQSEIMKVTDANNRGTARGDFAVLRQNLKPAILIELGFISNPEDESLLRTTAYQQKIVSGIVNGLRKYFSS